MKWFALLGTILFMLVSVPQTVSADGLPDLIIEDVRIEPGSFPYEQEFYCRLRNVGDVIVDVTISLSVKLQFCILLGMLPIHTIDSYIGAGNYVPGLNPGESIDIYFAHSDDLPRFGFYRFSCEVNPNSIIDEIDYNNNYYDEKSFVFLGYWKY